jgi:hypothetical protein
LAHRLNRPLAAEMDEHEQSGLPLPRCMEGASEPVATAFPQTGKQELVPGAPLLLARTR